MELGERGVMATWHVYRDRQCFAVSALTLTDAVAFATLRLRESVTELGPADPPSDLPGPLYATDYMGQHVELVHADEVNRVVNVVACERLTLQQWLDVLKTCLAHRNELSKRKPKVVAIRRFASGKRKGQLAFTAQHDASFRRKVQAAAEYNERLQHALNDARDRVEHTRNVAYTSLVDDDLPGSVDETRAMLKRLSELYERTGIDIPTRYRYVVARHFSQLVSVRDYGYPVDSTCILTRDPGAGPDEETPDGLCVVTGIYVDPYTDLSDSIHYRDVRMLADGSEYSSIPVEQLRPLP